ncbi:MAG: cytochrome b/b6 domain-containing protein, partial [Nitrospiraceae bacterium]
MKEHNANPAEQGQDSFIGISHMGLILFGITAWLTGDGADDYKEFRHVWFTVHGWIGMGLASSMFLYIVYCTFGPKQSRFTQRVPATREKLGMVREDIAGLLRFRLPDRQSHQGLAGLVQFFGVLIFTGMAVTGALMFFL